MLIYRTNFKTHAMPHAMPFSRDDIRLYHEVGRGSFGVVYLGIIIATGESVAVKKIDLEAAGAGDLDEISREIHIVSECKLPHITQYFGCFVHRYTLWILLEYVDGGLLHDAIESKPAISEPIILAILGEVLVALCYLHSRGTIHRDLKLHNILLSTMGNVKLTDFGVLTRLSSNMSCRNTTVGTPFWMAPEVVLGVHGHTFAADIWLLGCCAYEMLTGKPPLMVSHKPMQALQLLAQCRQTSDFINLIPWDTFTVSTELRDFMCQCFAVPSDKRPLAARLMQHPFLKLQISTIEREDAVRQLVLGNSSRNLMLDVLNDLVDDVTSIKMRQVEFDFDDETNNQDELDSFNMLGKSANYDCSEMILNKAINDNAIDSCKFIDLAINHNGCNIEVGDKSSKNRLVGLNCANGFDSLTTRQENIKQGHVKRNKEHANETCHQSESMTTVPPESCSRIMLIDRQRSKTGPVSQGSTSPIESRLLGFRSQSHIRSKSASERTLNTMSQDQLLKNHMSGLNARRQKKLERTVCLHSQDGLRHSSHHYSGVEQLATTSGSGEGSILLIRTVLFDFKLVLSRVEHKMETRFLLGPQDMKTLSIFTTTLLDLVRYMHTSLGEGKVLVFQYLKYLIKELVRDRSSKCSDKRLNNCKDDASQAGPTLNMATLADKVSVNTPLRNTKDSRWKSCQTLDSQSPDLLPETPSPGGLFPQEEVRAFLLRQIIPSFYLNCSTMGTRTRSLTLPTTEFDDIERNLMESWITRMQDASICTPR